MGRSLVPQIVLKRNNYLPGHIHVYMRSKLSLCAGLVLFLPFSAVFADPLSFTQIISFGDSLSDNGNATVLTAGTQPGANYAPGEFTDGANTSPATTGPYGLWVEQLAGLLKLPAPQPFLANPTNTNYAIGSAQSGTANPQDVGYQIAAFNTAHLGSAPSGALYTIWAGSDDILDGNSPVKAADNLYSYILALAGEGAKYFLWPNLVSLGATPEVRAGGPPAVAAANAASNAFDLEWAQDIASLKSKGINVIGVDVSTLFTQILANPAGYGFTDVTDPAQGTAGPANSYLFWDSLHPTTAGDRLVANLAYYDLGGVPEPANICLTLLGIGGVLAAVKRRRLTQNR